MHCVTSAKWCKNQELRVNASFDTDEKLDSEPVSMPLV